MLIVLKNGQPNGVAYSEDKPEFHAHHAQYGEKCVWLPGVRLEFDDGGNCVTTLTFAQLKEAKRSEVAASRWQAEVSGVNGIRTDRESQSMITGAALKAMQDSEYACKWKTEAGFVELTAAQILAIADAVREHVQGCFDREAELLALVEAATTPEEVELIRWEEEE